MSRKSNGLKVTVPVPVDAVELERIQQKAFASTEAIRSAIAQLPETMAVVKSAKLMQLKTLPDTLAAIDSATRERLQRIPDLMASIDSVTRERLQKLPSMMVELDFAQRAAFKNLPTTFAHFELAQQEAMRTGLAATVERTLAGFESARGAIEQRDHQDLETFVGSPTDEALRALPAGLCKRCGAAMSRARLGDGLRSVCGTCVDFLVPELEADNALEARAISERLAACEGPEAHPVPPVPVEAMPNLRFAFELIIGGEDARDLWADHLEYYYAYFRPHFSERKARWLFYGELWRSAVAAQLPWLTSLAEFLRKW